MEFYKSKPPEICIGALLILKNDCDTKQLSEITSLLEYDLNQSRLMCLSVKVPGPHPKPSWGRIFFGRKSVDYQASREILM